VVHELLASVPALRLVEHTQNQGYAAAQRTLIREARGELIFHVPADGEMSPCALPLFLQRMAEGYDIVVGVRRRKEYTWYRRLVSWLYNRLIVVLFWIDLRDVGGMRLAKAAVWKRLPARSQSATCMAERLLIAHRSGARIGFVPIEHRWRRTGRSKFNRLRSAWRAFQDLIALRLSLENNEPARGDGEPAPSPFESDCPSPVQKGRP
jgi:hypothetical protein